MMGMNLGSKFTIPIVFKLQQNSRKNSPLFKYSSAHDRLNMTVVILLYYKMKPNPMDKQYLCPKCDGLLRVGDNIVFMARNKRKKRGLILLHCEIGNYTSHKNPDFNVDKPHPHLAEAG